MTTLTPTDPTAARIERALANAGIEGWQVIHNPPTIPLGCYMLVLEERVLSVSPFWSTRHMTVGDESSHLPMVAAHERIVAIVRAILCSDWRSEIALRGVVPEVGPMLRYLTDAGFSSSVDKGAGDTWRGHYHRSVTRDVKHCVADTPEEALGMAILTFTEGEKP